MKLSTNRVSTKLGTPPTDPAKTTNASLAMIRHAYDTLQNVEKSLADPAPSLLRVKLLSELNNRTDISKADKLHFLLYAYTNDTSLRVVGFAGSIINKEPGADYLPLSVNQILNWWTLHEPDYQNTNSITGKEK